MQLQIDIWYLYQKDICIFIGTLKSLSKYTIYDRSLIADKYHFHIIVEWHLSVGVLIYTRAQIYCFKYCFLNSIKIFVCHR